MHIRPASPDDAQVISLLIHSVAHYFTLDADGLGAEEFLKTISAEAIQHCIRDPNFLYLAGFMDETLVGVAALRANKHLHHLFVAPQFQGRGYARALWSTARQKALQHGNPGEFTVNSTPFAEPVYAAFGFKAIGPRVETMGIAYIPMALSPHT
jgi:GNAT superfamily N-acetyltransferase